MGMQRHNAMAGFSTMAERPRALALRPLQLMIIVVALSTELGRSQPSIDGGRGDLPGMKQDMFDQVNRASKNRNQQRMGKAPPDCPKSDKMTPFMSMAFVGADLFVRLDSSEGTCHKLISVGGANLTELRNASLTCGPVGEWKKRIAEEMSAVFFQGGFEWVKNDNESIEVVTEEGTFQTEVSEAKYAQMMECWKAACGCEQANNPKMKIILFSLLICALGGLSYDSVKLALESFKETKPPKHVVSKKGHKMVEVAIQHRHICDKCGKTGTSYQCSGGSNYDLCTDCYKAERKKVKAKYREWLEKHPEDEDAKKKSKDEDKDKDDDDAKNAASGSEAGDKKDSKKESEPESDAPNSSEADKDGTTPQRSGDEEADDEKNEEEEK